MSHSSSLALAILLAGYLTVRCMTPPNPAADKTWKTDRISMLTHPLFIKAVQIAHYGLFIHHAAIVYFYDSSSDELPSPYLNPSLFTWNWKSASALAVVICLGAPLRLAAYGVLGGRFTFNLAAPDELQTTGIYSIVQHPSYTGMILVMAGCSMLFLRWDASPAMWVPDIVLDMLNGYGYVCFALAIAVVGYVLGVRIRDEEAMLKDTFGKKWVDWHKRTARIIPGVL